MIKSIVIITLLTFYANAFMVESSYEKAHAKALKAGKSLVVFLTKKNCPQCNVELAKIIHNKAISLAINKYAVFVIIKEGQKESYPIEMLYTTQYPALFILDNNELPQCSASIAKFDIQHIIQCFSFNGDWYN